MDGFPRTIAQGKALEKLANIYTVIHLDVPFDILRRRALGRRTCSGCGEIYNVSTYKKSTCDKCNSPLFQRDDDNLEAVENRLEVYAKQTAPLIDFYAEKVFKVFGGKTPEETYKPVKNFLEGKI